MIEAEAILKIKMADMLKKNSLLPILKNSA